jgi:hypothetical protein
LDGISLTANYCPFLKVPFWQIVAVSIMAAAIDIDFRISVKVQAARRLHG